LLTLFLVLASLIFAILVPSISELFTLLGSTTGALIAFILPTAIYLRLGQHGEKQRVRRHLCVVMLVIASLLAVATTVRSLIFIAETKAHDLRQSPESAHINKPETPTASATQIAS
jgi:amino acid transporter